MTPNPNAIDGDIARFLSDAGSEHQAFSKRSLRDYLAAEGHDEQDLVEAISAWSSVWLGSARSDDEFSLDHNAWAEVGVKCPQVHVRVGDVTAKAQTIFHDVAHWAAARLGQEIFS